MFFKTSQLNNEKVVQVMPKNLKKIVNIRMIELKTAPSRYGIIYYSA
ncbi:hypothetical protein LEP1GSC016_2669 [Leptospira borgpetersenii serovar Hardjo-bovis str. Sponselee]|uniref:Uncharacterized protein n=1 Tax=Leptospira borgpetersenii serovar Hardjo-bovis str. Sponselee TaxID=1303729 RepID=M6C079_LEPBO|nr:hypothetical protein LEP1GSC016_2669 [Leptospira borgpetersenii serovar Hardjo-bovis str. Sponselee]